MANIWWTEFIPATVEKLGFSPIIPAAAVSWLKTAGKVLPIVGLVIAAAALILFLGYMYLVQKGIIEECKDKFQKIFRQLDYLEKNQLRQRVSYGEPRREVPAGSIDSDRVLMSRLEDLKLDIKQELNREINDYIARRVKDEVSKMQQELLKNLSAAARESQPRENNRDFKLINWQSRKPEMQKDAPQADGGEQRPKKEQERESTSLSNMLYGRLASRQSDEEKAPEATLHSASPGPASYFRPEQQYMDDLCHLYNEYFNLTDEQKLSYKEKYQFQTVAVEKFMSGVVSSADLIDSSDKNAYFYRTGHHLLDGECCLTIPKPVRHALNDLEIENYRPLYEIRGAVGGERKVILRRPAVIRREKDRFKLKEKGEIEVI